MTTVNSSEAINESIEFAPEEEVIDPIKVIYQDDCQSLTARSILTFEIGEHPDATLYFRIARNSHGGHYSNQWIPISILQDIFLGATDLNSRSLQPAYGQTSVNTPGFCLASLKALGLVEVDPANGRIHRHVVGTVFAQVIRDRIAESKVVATRTARKKAKEG